MKRLDGLLVLAIVVILGALSTTWMVQTSEPRPIGQGIRIR